MGVFMFWIIASASGRDEVAGASSTCLLVAEPTGFGGGPCRSQAPSMRRSPVPTARLTPSGVMRFSSYLIPGVSKIRFVRHESNAELDFLRRWRLSYGRKVLRCGNSCEPQSG